MRHVRTLVHPIFNHPIFPPTYAIIFLWLETRPEKTIFISQLRQSCALEINPLHRTFAELPFANILMKKSDNFIRNSGNMWCGQFNPLLHFHNNKAFVRRQLKVNNVFQHNYRAPRAYYFTLIRDIYISRNNGLRDVWQYDGKTAKF